MSIVRSWVSFSTCRFSAGVHGMGDRAGLGEEMRCDERNIVAVMKYYMILAFCWLVQRCVFRVVYVVVWTWTAVPESLAAGGR